MSALFAYGWSIIGLGIIISLIITKKPWKNKKMDSYVDDKAEYGSVES